MCGTKTLSPKDHCAPVSPHTAFLAPSRFEISPAPSRGENLGFLHLTTQLQITGNKTEIDLVPRTRSATGQYRAMAYSINGIGGNRGIR
jgi:hypothetical protein